MLKIDWIRHTSLVITGETCYGQTDVLPSATFEEEAKVVLQKLAPSYDAVFTSPLSRAEMLATYCGFGESAIREPRIMERAFGKWEMKPWADVFALVEQNPTLYTDNRGELLPPGGESVNELIERVHRFVEEVRRQRYSRVAIFCHGGVINSARYCQGLIELADLFVGVPDYGSVTTLEYAHLE